MHFVMVKHPGRIGIAAIVIEHIFGKAKVEFRRGVFTRMDRGHHVENRLGAADRRIGQLQQAHVGTVAATQR